MLYENHSPFADGSAMRPSTFWEGVATTRWGRYLTEVEHRLILNAQALAGSPSQAFEVGCDGGRWVKVLSDLGWQMSCTDTNRDSLDICSSRVPRAECTLVSTQATRLPCASASQTLLLCIEV